MLIRKQELDKRFEETLNALINYSDKLKNLTPYNPIELKIPKNSHIINKTIADIKLWQHTGATIVALRRNTEIIISPGPAAVFQANDRLVVVGKPDVLGKVTKYINK